MAPADPVAGLYAVPPDEFTAARNRLAAELRASGRAAEARAVAQIRKPSPALWAVNRVAATDPRTFTAFIEAVERLRQAQLNDPGAAAAAVRAHREALDALLDRARRLLREAGLKGSQAVVRRVGDTLMGAAVDRTLAAALRRGVLTRELPAPGFEAFSGTRVSAAPLRLVARRRPQGPTSDDDHHRQQARAVKSQELARERERREREHEREQQRERQQRAREEREREERERQERELARQADELQRQVTDLEAEHRATRARLGELEQRLRSARRAAREAAAAARRHRRGRP